ncbi:MAG: hypothetical protein RLZZ553_1180 [Verrucomicrobiota bacterium]|jgi:hypothetical protein
MSVFISIRFNLSEPEEMNTTGEWVQYRATGESALTSFATGT